MNLKLNYLCLDVTREGQASYTHVHEIISGLRRRDIEVRLYQPYYVNRSESPKGIFRAIGILACQIELLLQLKDVDCIYIRSHFGAFFTTLMAKILHKPLIIEVNGPYEDLFIAWPWTAKFRALFEWLMRIQFIWADSLVTVTPELKEWLLLQGVKKKPVIIPNGVNIDIFRPGVPFGFQLPKPYVIFFGALAAWQGIDTLLQAFESQLWPKNVYLVIVGDGKERSRVEEMAKRQTHLIYLGRVPYQVMPGLIGESLCAVSPKNNLGGRSTTGLSPLKVYETMACAIPIIVTDFPGQADLVRNCQCGIVVPPEDPEALASAVNQLVNMGEDERMEMGNRGRNFVEKYHSWDIRAGATYKLLEELCCGGK